MANPAFTFTKQALDALPVPAKGKRDTYHDKKTPGLQLRVTDTGSKTFVVFRRVSGVPTRHTIGRYPDVAIDLARRKADEAKGAIARGEDPNDQMRSERNDLTLSALFAVYLEKHAKRKKRSWESDDWQFNKYLAGRLGSGKIASITRTDIRELHHTIGEDNGKYTANRLVAQLRGMYNFAKKYELFAGENPAERIDLHPEQSRERRLNADEMPAFWQALDNEPNQDIRDYVMLSLATAARKANVLAMRWDQINLEGERPTWTIPLTKNGKPQSVVLVTDAVALLRQRQAGSSTSPYVFPGIGGSGHLADPKKGWKRILDRAGIADLHLHDLRRTMGSYMADTGASLHIISKALNHQNPSTTAIYARLSQDPVRHSMETAAKAMFGGIAGQE